MALRCPGQDGRNLQLEVIKCPGCGAGVEIFSDEVAIKCQKCGARVCREIAPSCYQWCPAARACLGEERWQALKRSESRNQEDRAS